MGKAAVIAALKASFKDPNKTWDDAAEDIVNAAAAVDEGNVVTVDAGIAVSTPDTITGTTVSPGTGSITVTP